MFNRIKGCLFGGAIGDALGFPVEFLEDFVIFKNYGERGVTSLNLYPMDEGKRAFVSDDTQMTLFTADGLLKARDLYRTPTLEQYRNCVYESYLDWLYTQEGGTLNEAISHSPLLRHKQLFARRAPGGTCLSALRLGRCGSIRFPINDSKGCGGVMRVAPVGILLSREERFGIEEIGVLGGEVAAITHGHELGYLPSAMLAMLVAYLGRGQGLLDSVLAARDASVRLFSKCKHLDYFLQLMDRAIALAKEEGDDLDCIRQLGEGWVAEETLAIALYCALKYERDFEGGLIASVNHSGDSDSTGAVTGNVLGAHLGYAQISDAFKGRLDVEEILEDVCDKLCGK